MKRAFGCIFFFLAGLAWTGYFGLLLLFSHFGDCADDQVCLDMQNARAMRDFLFGLGGGVLICVAYAAYRRFVEDKDVQ